MAEFLARTAEEGREVGVAHYMQQEAFATGTAPWQQMRSAITRWIAADSIQLSVVESPNFRRMCKALNGRCPSFSRKAVTNEVRCYHVVACIVCNMFCCPMVSM